MLIIDKTKKKLITPDIIIKQYGVITQITECQPLNSEISGLILNQTINFQGLS